MWRFLILQKDKEEKEYSELILQALEGSVILERYPKSVIDIYILVLEEDGGKFKVKNTKELLGSLGAAITCASLALINGGIETYDFVSCCSVVSTLVIIHF